MPVHRAAASAPPPALGDPLVRRHPRHQCGKFDRHERQLQLRDPTDNHNLPASPDDGKQRNKSRRMMQSPLGSCPLPYSCATPCGRLKPSSGPCGFKMRVHLHSLGRLRLWHRSDPRHPRHPRQPRLPIRTYLKCSALRFRVPWGRSAAAAAATATAATAAGARVTGAAGTG